MKKQPECPLCTGEAPCIYHKHVGDCIVALFLPQTEDDDFRLAVFWLDNEQLRRIAVNLDDEQEAAYYYHYALCGGTAKSARETVTELLHAPRGYGGLPAEPACCGHCGQRSLEPVHDLFGDYWACFYCGWTSDATTVPPDIFLETQGERLIGAKV